jgi:hypothetical protein
MPTTAGVFLGEMVMIRPLTAALLVAAYYGLMPSPAQGQTCQSRKDADAETAAEAAKFGGTVLTLKGSQAEHYLAVVNAVPPVTHLDAPVVLLLVIPDQGAVIGLVLGENVCIAGHIGAAVHKRAIEAAQGRDT